MARLIERIQNFLLEVLTDDYVVDVEEHFLYRGYTVKQLGHSACRCLGVGTPV
jgi:hypothetical protein